MNKENLFHLVALSLVPGIGPVNAKSLIGYCGSASNIFKTKKHALLKIPGIGDATAASILEHTVFKRAEQEMEYIEKHQITCLPYLDEGYPQRLRHCIDAPIILFYKGNADLNQEKVIGVVGTRNCTEYGKQICEQLVEDLKDENLLVVSGLAYGIDIATHKACVKKNVATVGVMAHGLDRMYPQAHKEIAKKMVNHGGLLTEFMSNTNPDRQNFPRRNRIVAGMIDALVVVETAENGGAIITALLADSYNRDVMAFPGNIHNTFSKGCNSLIKSNRAALIESANDLLEIMQWKTKEAPKATQRSLFIELEPEEQLLIDIIKDKQEIGIDDISFISQLTPSILAGHLLNLEFKGIIAALPGKQYRMV